MTIKIKIKRSESANSVPTTSELEVGEICMNVADQKIYTRKSDDSIVTISETNTGKPSLELTSTDAGSTEGPTLNLYRNSFSPFDSDAIGNIKFYGENDNTNKIVYANIVSKINDATSSTEDGELELQVRNDGTVEQIATVKTDGLHIASGKALNFADGTSMTTKPGDEYGIALDGLLVKNPDGSSGGISIDGILTKAGANDAIGKIGKLLDDTSPMLGGNLDLNSNNISGTGTVTATSFHGDGSNLTNLPAGYNDADIKADILKLAICQAVDGNRIAFNLSDSFIDGFEDSSGCTTLTDVVRDSSGEYISTGSETNGAYESDANTLLLLHMDGSDNGSVFTDSSSHNRTVTNTGSPVTKTGQKKYGTASWYSGSTGNAISVPDHSDWSYIHGENDFTVECWIYLNSYPSGSNSTYEFFNQAQSNTSDATGAIHFNIGADYKLNNNIYRRNGSSTSDDWNFKSPSNIPLSTWTHVALARQANNLRMYVDGTQVNTQAVGQLNGNYKMTETDLGGNVWISRRAYSTGYGWTQGYIDEYRISNICRYPDGTSFTPGLWGSMNATGTLISDPQTASSSRTSLSGVVVYEDSEGTATLGTDLKIYFTADNGSNWTEASSYGNANTFTGTKKIVSLGNTTVTSGTQIALKAVWANQSSGSKETRLHGWAVNY